MYLHVTKQNDERKITDVRNELRKQQFFHKEYKPELDNPNQRRLNMKIYVPNSHEPDFKNQPDVEPSLNHFLLA